MEHYGMLSLQRDPKTVAKMNDEVYVHQDDLERDGSLSTRTTYLYLTIGCNITIADNFDCGQQLDDFATVSMRCRP